MLLPILIVAGVVAQAMAHKYTEYTYIPGFFVQDDLNANATEIGAVRYSRSHSSALANVSVAASSIRAG